MITASDFLHPGPLPWWAILFIALFVAVRLVALVCALRRGDRQIREHLSQSIDRRNLTPTDRTQAEMGLYAADPRIRVIHGNFVLLRDGQVLSRVSARYQWRRYLPPDGRLDTGLTHQWRHIASALQAVLGDALPVVPGRKVVEIRGGR